jgi:hypothetical protein
MQSQNQNNNEKKLTRHIVADGFNPLEQFKKENDQKINQNKTTNKKIQKSENTQNEHISPNNLFINKKEDKISLDDELKLNSKDNFKKNNEQNIQNNIQSQYFHNNDIMTRTGSNKFTSNFMLDREYIKNNFSVNFNIFTII